MISIMNNQIHSTIDRYTYALEPIDGDLRKARPVDRTVDFGYPEQLGVEWLRYGRPVERELLPTRLEVMGTDKAVPRRLVELPDITSTLGAFVVSHAFRETIERFEPTLHQFEPVRIVYAKGEEEPRPFYIMVAGQRVVIALDHTRTQPPMREIPERPGLVKPDPTKPLYSFNSGTPIKDWAPVFRHEAVLGRHLFCAADFRNYLFVSADLRQAIEDAGMKGAVFRGPFAVTGAAEGGLPTAALAVGQMREGD